MKQVVQNYKTGKITLEEIPIPLLKSSGVIVKNYYSLISVGTEKAKLSIGKKSLIGKAKLRPDLVRKVLDAVKRNGLVDTAKTVFRKLDEFTPLGYSSSGRVVDVSDDVEEIRVGDFVACAGAGYANHAEYIYVPKNLVCKIPKGVDLIDASFTTIGSIAVQGVRLLNSQIGERVLVIGLGLIGQLVVQILNAGGVKVFGIDIIKSKIDKAINNGLSEGCVIDSSDIGERVKNFTNDRGFDGVIISASTESNKPIEIAGKYCRDKGRIVVIGKVCINIPREDYYKKELEIVVSRSYGPGRYDKNYEEKGIDYPYGYVRWTEKRNMESFLELIKDGKVNVKSLITKVYSLEDYNKAYEDILSDKSNNNFGLIFKYEISQSEENKKGKIRISQKRRNNGEINVSFIGAGNYAKRFLIPLFSRNRNVKLYSIYSATGLSAKNVAKKYKFLYVSDSLDDIFFDKRTNLIVISTTHDTHYEYVIKALKNNKNVFVEKPLCINRYELEDIREAYNESNSVLMVGFNRRFSVLTDKVKEVFENRNYPLIINYRINAGEINKESWIQDIDVGGGRIVGELCHFIDYVIYIIRREITSIYATGIRINRKLKLIDNLIVSINFEDGSIASISYISSGSELLFKEYIEVFGGGASVIIRDFKVCEIFSNSSTKKIKLRSQDKGQYNQIKVFLNKLTATCESPIPFNEIYNSTLGTFLVLDSLKTGKKITINE